MPKIITPIQYFGQREIYMESIFNAFIVEQHFNHFFDLCSGSGSISFGFMQKKIAKQYSINDSYKPLTQLWERILLDPKAVISEYQRFYYEYSICESKEERVALYDDWRKQFNRTKDPILFSFLLNQAQNNWDLPRFNQAGEFMNPPKPDFDSRVTKDIIFEERVVDLHKLFLQSGTVNMTSGSFLDYIDKIQEGDLALFDPPYPHQDKGIYFNLEKTDDELHQKLLGALTKLLTKKASFILLYGGGPDVLAKDYFDELPEVKHYVRLSHYEGFGDCIEHLYTSPDLKPSTTLRNEKIISYQELYESGMNYNEMLNKFREILKANEQFASRTQLFALNT